MVEGSCFVGLVSTKIAVFSVYMSPNCDIETFIGGVEELSDVIRQQGGLQIVVCGDFNSKHSAWGGNVTNERGKILLDAVSGMDLVCVNGDSPTFSVPGRMESYIDLCFVNESALRFFREWRLQEDVTLSDHNAIDIMFEKALTETTTRPKRQKVSIRALEEFGRAFERELRSTNEVYPEDLTVVAREIIGERMQERKREGTPVYWWTPDIAELRKKCMSARRRSQRIANGQTETGIRARQEFIETRKQYKRAIAASKKKCWEKLCDELEEDIWGDEYRIAMKRMGKTLPCMDESLFSEVIEVVFPPGAYERKEYVADTDIPPFTLQKLNDAAILMSKKKSPGPDGIPSEYVREMVRWAPNKLLAAMNFILRNEWVPDTWKVARMVLIHKEGKKRDDPGGYRPICLINGIAKLLERLIVGRLWTHVETVDCLSPDQYGFRKGRSTVEAMEAVMEVVNELVTGSWRTRRIPVMVCLPDDAR